MASKASGDMAPNDLKHAPQQDSPLLKLPAEMKNRIYEFVIPHDTFVTLRAEKISTGSNEAPAYRYSPSLPLLSICREIRNDVLGLLPDYYASNLFLFQDTIFLPDAMKGFMEIRKEVIGHIRKVRVAIRVLVPMVFDPAWARVTERRDIEIGDGQTKGSRATFDVTFVAERTAAGTRIRNLKAETKHPGVLDAPSLDSGLCCCTLKAMVKELDQESAQENGTLVDVVARYTDMVAAHHSKFEVQRDNDDFTLILCQHCGFPYGRARPF